MADIDPASVGSFEFIVIKLAKVNQTGCGDAYQDMFVAQPIGFVTIVGRKRIKGAPIW
jgi:hypothetical protein